MMVVWSRGGSTEYVFAMPAFDAHVSVNFIALQSVSTNWAGKFYLGHAGILLPISAYPIPPGDLPNVLSAWQQIMCDAMQLEGGKAPG
jgi:hypothetical protein